MDIITNNSKAKKTGFTLIELLVTIGIISVLIAIMSVSFSNAREGTKNKVFRTELKEMQLAIEQYFAQNGEYPKTSFSAGCTSSGLATTTAQTTTAGCNGLTIIDGLVPEYIADLPHHSDSLNPNCDIVYDVDTVYGSWYKLTAERCFEGATNASTGIQPDDELARCPSNCAECDGVAFDATYKASAASYESTAVYSVGGQCD